MFPNGQIKIATFKPVILEHNLNYFCTAAQAWSVEITVGSRTVLKYSLSFLKLKKVDSSDLYLTANVGIAVNYGTLPTFIKVCGNISKLKKIFKNKIL